MLSRRNIGTACFCALSLLVAAGCGKLDETVSQAQDKISSTLRTQGIYERGNLPDNPPPTPEQIKGYFEIIGGAYRHVVNESRDGRNSAFEIAPGDSIAFMFDARIFTGGNFDNLQTFYTNIESRRELLTGNNSEFDGRFWPIDPLRIKVGDDPRILKSLQQALIGGTQPCRAGDGNPENDDAPGGIASDEVRVYLTPDIAFGDRTVYNVPARSTIVFELTDIEIIK